MSDRFLKSMLQGYRAFQAGETLSAPMFADFFERDQDEFEPSILDALFDGRKAATIQLYEGQR